MKRHARGLGVGAKDATKLHLLRRAMGAAMIFDGAITLLTGQRRTDFALKIARKCARIRGRAALGNQP